MKIDKYRRLAVVHALASALKEEEARLRAECDAEAVEQYRESGVKQREITLGDGSKVGSYCVTVASKPEFMVEDAAALENSLRASGYIVPVSRIIPERLPLDEVARLWPEAVVVDEETDGRWRKGLQVVSVEGLQRIINADGVFIEGVRKLPEYAKGTRLSGCSYEAVSAVITPEEARAALEGAGLLLMAGEV